MNALVLLNGERPGNSLLKEEAERSDLIVCADGAFEYALDCGITPDVIIGDMDSCSGDAGKRIENKEIENIKFPCEKDETDALLAIDYAVDKGAGNIVLLGATGLRIDHTYANLMLMYRTKDKGVNIISKDSSCDIMVAVEKETASITGRKGLTVSLLPFGGDVHIIKTEGLKWNVENRNMNMDFPYGISNVMTDNEALVEIGKGCLLIIINKTLYF